MSDNRYVLETSGQLSVNGRKSNSMDVTTGINTIHYVDIKQLIMMIYVLGIGS